MTLQTWEGIGWTHQLQVYQPKGIAPNAVMLLYNTGGKAGDANIAFDIALAQQVGAPCAVSPPRPYRIVQRPQGVTQAGQSIERFQRMRRLRLPVRLLRPGRAGAVLRLV